MKKSMTDLSTSDGGLQVLRLVENYENVVYNIAFFQKKIGCSFGHYDRNRADKGRY